MNVNDMDPADKKVYDMVETLKLQYDELQYDDSDEGSRRRSEIRAKLRRLSHDQIHPGEGEMILDMPLSVTGEPFTINEHPYVGVVTVPNCVGSTLLHMIDANRRVDQERMRETGRTQIIGHIGNLAKGV